MMALHAKLEALGIAQYTRILHDNGFEDWETVLDITEEDLNSLGIKLGHRRILQKEIANTRSSQALSSPQTECSRRSPPSSHTGHGAPALDAQAKRAKRQYRWHPRADPNAPKKPKTAYVNFADHLRAEASIASLSFVDIAREVGKRWQSMLPSHKQEWENQAAQAMQIYEDRMDEYRTTKKYQEYQAYLETFKKAPGKAARQKIQLTPSAVTSPLRSDSSGPEFSPLRTFASPALPSTDDRLREGCKTAVEAALSGLVCCQHSLSEDQAHNLKDLPSESLCRRAIAALMDGEHAIFYVMGATEAERLINQVYQASNPPSALKLAELCALACVGSQLVGAEIPSRERQRLFCTARVLLDNIIPSTTDYLPMMRILLCLAIYLINMKYLGARSFVAAGLVIAKMTATMMSPHENKEDWRKVYRTLVFIDCWLAQASGTAVSNLDIHTWNAVEPALSKYSLENTIQWQAVRIAILSNEISTTIRQPTPVSTMTLDHFAGQLDAWQRDLPHEMQLASLLASNDSSIHSNHGCAMLTVHIFYLGTVLLLHGHRLIQAENVVSDSSISPDPLQKRNTCLAAAEQIAVLLRSIEAKRPWTARSWLLIYWTFSACNVLLLGAAQALRARATNDHDRLISYFRICLNTVQSCANDEPIAARYLNLVHPIYENLLGLRESPHRDLVRTNSNHKISINDLLASESTTTEQKTQWRNLDQELPSVVQSITALLKDPFGRLTGTDNPGDPYPSPPINVDTLFWFQ